MHRVADLALVVAACFLVLVTTSNVSAAATSAGRYAGACDRSASIWHVALVVEFRFAGNIMLKRAIITGIGDPAKARAELDWRRAVDFDGLVRMMVDANLERLAADRS